MLTELFENSSEKSSIYNRNSLLFDAENLVEEIYFVKQGSVGLFTKISGKEQIIRLAYSGSIIFAPDSFLGGETTKYYARTLKKSEIISVNKNNLFKYFSGKEEKLQAIYSQIILDLCERELDLLHHSSAERFNRLLARSPKVFQEIPHKYIASYLRISPETLSRLKKS